MYIIFCLLFVYLYFWFFPVYILSFFLFLFFFHPISELSFFLFVVLRIKLRALPTYMHSDPPASSSLLGHQVCATMPRSLAYNIFFVCLFKIFQCRVGGVAQCYSVIYEPSFYPQKQQNKTKQKIQWSLPVLVHVTIHLFFFPWRKTAWLISVLRKLTFQQ